MKPTLVTKQLAPVVALLLTANLITRTPVSTVKLTTVRSQHEPQRDSVFYGNPLLLNNRPFDYANFSIASQGILTMVIGNSETAEIEKIPFRIYVRRDGKIIHSGASDTTQTVYSIDVASVLAVAKSGDNLVIEPTRKRDVQAKQSIKLKGGYFYPNLFAFLKKRDGC